MAGKTNNNRNAYSSESEEADYESHSELEIDA